MPKPLVFETISTFALIDSSLLTRQNCASRKPSLTYSPRCRVASAPPRWGEKGTSDRGVCFAAGLGLWVGAGGSRGWIAGAIAAPSFTAPPASGLPRCSGSKWRPGRRQQGEADAGRHLDNTRAELQKPQTDGGELGRGR